MNARLAIMACGAALLLGSIPAGAQTAPPRDVARLKALMASPAFAKARASLDADWDRIIEEITTLTEIPAPPFQEAERAKAYAAMFAAHGLADVEIDPEGNVLGLREGKRTGLPLLVVAAHLDTVFPAGTDLKVRRDGDRLAAPGIGDDVSGLAALLAFIRALDRAGIRTDRDILFVGNVGEEGPGNLRGVRYLFQKGKYKDRIARFVSIETSRDFHFVTNGGIGSRRYRISFRGPGGHSYHAFGIVNPAQALGNAIVAFGRMPVPKSPKTTFNIGIVEGGTSVNSIPYEVSMTVDMRSESKEALKAQDDYLMSILAEAVGVENAARSTQLGKITYEAKLIGERPVGSTPVDSRSVRLATAAINAAGFTPIYQSASSDSNIPMSMGIEAVTLGSGFIPDRFHSLEESILLDRQPTLLRMEISLATLIALAATD